MLTMYHDQGQIAMKLMGFDRGVTLFGGFPSRSARQRTAPPTTSQARELRQSAPAAPRCCSRQRWRRRRCRLESALRNDSGQETLRMNPGLLVRFLSVIGVVALLVSGSASAAEVHVMISAGFYRSMPSWARRSSARAATA